MTHEKKYVHASYGLWLTVEVPFDLPPRKVSIRPGRGWLNRVTCRIKGHVPLVLVNGRCPRCRWIGDYDAYVRAALAGARRGVDEQVRAWLWERSRDHAA